MNDRSAPEFRQGTADARQGLGRRQRRDVQKLAIGLRLRGHIARVRTTSAGITVTFVTSISGPDGRRVDRVVGNESGVANNSRSGLQRFDMLRSSIEKIFRCSGS